MQEEVQRGENEAKAGETKAEEGASACSALGILSDRETSDQSLL
jgi:hypothetical protein